jgi:hypothetical protein
MIVRVDENLYISQLENLMQSHAIADKPWNCTAVLLGFFYPWASKIFLVVQYAAVCESFVSTGERHPVPAIPPIEKEGPALEVRPAACPVLVV